MKKDKILLELEKSKEKAAVHQARIKELERLKTEAESVEVMNIVRGFNMTHDELLVFLKQCRAEEIMPVQSQIIMKEGEINNEKIEEI